MDDNERALLDDVRDIETRAQQADEIHEAELDAQAAQQEAEVGLEIKSSEPEQTPGERMEEDVEILNFAFAKVREDLRHANNMPRGAARDRRLKTITDMMSLIDRHLTVAREMLELARGEARVAYAKDLDSQAKEILEADDVGTEDGDVNPLKDALPKHDDHRHPSKSPAPEQEFPTYQDAQGNEHEEF